jgi:putative serine protease PepD
VVALGAGAAGVSSLLTAGVVTAVRGDGTTSATGSSAGSGTGAVAQAAPLVPGLTGTATDWVTPAAKVGPSVVSVRVQASDGTGDEGSGVILDRLGRVLTNNHVVSAGGGGASILVVLSDGRAYNATVVGADPATDLAVLVMKKPPSTLQPATFADSSAVKVGDPVMAIGNPLGLSSTVTTGIVSALDRPVNTGSSTQSQSPFGSSAPQAEAVVTNAIQTDAAINPGNSGGALVDAAGRVIGITSSIASLGSSSTGQAGSIGIGFAIPANEAKDVADQLIATGTVKHAYLGVTLSDGTVTVDGSDSLVAQIRAVHPGTAVALTIVRSGATQTITVTLAARPAGS